MYPVSLIYDAGLGNVAIYLRLRYGLGFWDFANEQESAIETADCRVFLTELPVSVAESWYVADITVPANGPFPVEIVLLSTGDKIGNDLAPSSAASGSGSVIVGSGDYAPNRAQILQDAMEICGYEFNSADPDAIESASRTLNSLIKALNTNGTDVNVIVRTVLPLVAGTAAYSIDARGIDGAYLGVNGNDSPVFPLTSAQYFAKTNKATQGRPTHFYHDKQSGLLYLHPVPDSAYNLTYGRIREYAANLDQESAFDFPASAMEMLTFGLAHRLSFKQGFSLPAGEQDRVGATFAMAEKRYIVANSAYTKGQITSSCMVV